jgi:hypothetical protein
MRLLLFGRSFRRSFVAPCLNVSLQPLRAVMAAVNYDDLDIRCGDHLGWAGHLRRAVLDGQGG